MDCWRCGLTVDESEAVRSEVPLRQGGHHLRLSCPGCKSFLKFQAHSKKKIFYFGKYKGREVSAVALFDRPYLAWLLKQDWLKDSLRQAIEEALRCQKVA